MSCAYLEGRTGMRGLSRTTPTRLTPFGSGCSATPRQKPGGSRLLRPPCDDPPRGHGRSLPIRRPATTSTPHNARRPGLPRTERPQARPVPPTRVTSERARARPVHADRPPGETASTSRAAHTRRRGESASTSRARRTLGQTKSQLQKPHPQPSPPHPTCETREEHS